MNPEFAIELLKLMIYQSLTIAAPILLTAMVIGLCISLFQAVTTISEQTLTFVPKALGVIGIVLILLPWIVRSLIEFTTAVIMKMPEMVQ
jgi:flagellar biosynthetic protein FliQ